MSENRGKLAKQARVSFKGMLGCTWSICMWLLSRQNQILIKFTIEQIMRHRSPNVSPVPEHSSRNPLLPFDEISSPAVRSERKRHNTFLLNFVPRFWREMKDDLVKKQQKRLSILQKINDPSYEQISFKESLAQTIEYALSKRIKCFRPDQTFILLWNLFMLIAITFNFLEIPISLCLTDQVYQTQSQNWWALSLNILFIIAMFVDSLFIRTNLAFYRNGKVIVKKSFIFSNYIQYDFPFDAISWLVYLIYAVSGIPKLAYLKLLFYLKVKTVAKINNQILFALATYRVRLGIYKLLRTIILLWLMTTWVSCIYFAIDYHYYQEKGFYFNTGQLWLTNSNAIDNLNLLEIFPYWYVWYEYAVYWSFQTSATIGYGDMTPRNPHEVLYCNFIILINTVFFAFYINTIWQIIRDLQEYYRRYIQNWENLKNYLKTGGIDKNLSGKIDNFLHEMWINENQDYDEDELNNILSTELKIELVGAIRTNFFKGLPVFEEMASFTSSWVESVKEISCHIEKQKFGSNHKVYKFGEKTEFLYYLVYGKVGLNVKQLDIGRQIDLGNHLCAEQFFSGENYFTDASTFSFCVMWKLSRHHFLSSLKHNLHLYFKYCQIKERLILQQELPLCKSECLKCKELTHNYQSCPKINKWRNKIAKPYYGYKKLESTQNSRPKRYARKYVKAQKIRNIWLNKKDQVDGVFNFEGYRIQKNVQKY